MKQKGVFKRTLSLFLATFMLISILPFNTFAQGAATQPKEASVKKDDELNWNEEPRSYGRNYWPLNTSTTPKQTLKNYSYNRGSARVSDLTYGGYFVNEKGETVIRIRWLFASSVASAYDMGLFKFDPLLESHIDFNKTYIVRRGLQGQYEYKAKMARFSYNGTFEGSNEYKVLAVPQLFEEEGMAGWQADIMLVLKDGRNIDTLKSTKSDLMIQTRIQNTETGEIVANYRTGNEPADQIPYNTYTYMTVIPFGNDVTDNTPMQFRSWKDTTDAAVISRTTNEYLADKGVLISRLMLFKPLWGSSGKMNNLSIGYREVVDAKMLDILKPKDAKNLNLVDGEGNPVSNKGRKAVGRIYSLDPDRKSKDGNGEYGPTDPKYYQEFTLDDFNIKGNQAELLFVQQDYQNRENKKVVTVQDAEKIFYYDGADIYGSNVVIEYYIDPVKVDDHFKNASNDNTYTFAQNTAFILNQPKDGFMPYYKYTTTEELTIQPGVWKFEIPGHATGARRIYRPTSTGPSTFPDFWATIGDIRVNLNKTSVDAPEATGETGGAVGATRNAVVQSEHGMVLPPGTDIILYYPLTRVANPNFKPTFDLAGTKVQLEPYIGEATRGWTKDGYTGDFIMDKTRHVHALELTGTQYKPYADEIFTDATEFTGAVINKEYKTNNGKDKRIDYYPGATIVADWTQVDSENNTQEHREYTYAREENMTVRSKGVDYKESRPFTITKSEGSAKWDLKKDMRVDFRTSVAGQLPSAPTTKQVKAKVTFDYNYDQSLTIFQPSRNDTSVLGKAEPGSTILVTLKNGTVHQATADAKGDWKVETGGYKFESGETVEAKAIGKGQPEDFDVVAPDNENYYHDLNYKGNGLNYKGDNRMPEEPKREGYIFKGWYTIKNPRANNDAFTGETPVYENMTVYANWVKGDNKKLEAPTVKQIVNHKDGRSQISGKLPAKNPEGTNVVLVINGTEVPVKKDNLKIVEDTVTGEKTFTITLDNTYPFDDRTKDLLDQDAVKVIARKPDEQVGNKIISYDDGVSHQVVLDRKAPDIISKTAAMTEGQMLKVRGKIQDKNLVGSKVLITVGNKTPVEASVNDEGIFDHNVAKSSQNEVVKIQALDKFGNKTELTNVYVEPEKEKLGLSFGEYWLGQDYVTAKSIPGATVKIYKNKVEANNEIASAIVGGTGSVSIDLDETPTKTDKIIGLATHSDYLPSEELIINIQQ